MRAHRRQVRSDGITVMTEPVDLLTTTQKALTVNLDVPVYGTFAEIGAGQEVARQFFHVGGASGTVAKSISAYDMVFSDAIYGQAPRYVSSERLALMLDHEYGLLLDRLSSTRAERTTFFVFADTVATRNHAGTNEAHGWLGFRFQSEPLGAASQIVLHVRMWDDEATLQQEALGIVGVNLIYAALYYRTDATRFIESLKDNLTIDRIEIDMLRFSGSCFLSIDNRLMSLYLVQFGLTNAVMFGAAGDVLQPSEVLHKKAILVERGSFRPVTHVNVDMITCAMRQFVQEPEVRGGELVVLMEITIANLLADGDLDAPDFLARVDLLSDAGYTVLISNYPEYYRLTSYFRRYSKEMIGVAVGINHVLSIFDEKYYDTLEGGILEAFGRLFRHAVKFYVYPMKSCAYEAYLARYSGVGKGMLRGSVAPNTLVTANTVRVAGHLGHLYSHLLESHNIVCIAGFNEAALDIFSRDVLRQIRSHDRAWETSVPLPVAESIKRRGLFGYIDSSESAVIDGRERSPPRRDSCQ